MPKKAKVCMQNFAKIIGDLFTFQDPNIDPTSLLEPRNPHPIIIAAIININTIDKKFYIGYENRIISVSLIKLPQTERNGEFEINYGKFEKVCPNTYIILPYFHRMHLVSFTIR